MKFKHHEVGDTTHVTLVGLIDVEGCTCLENFFDARVAGSNRLDLDLGPADLSAAGAVDVLAGLLARAVREGTQVVVRNAPPALMHEFARRDADATGHLTFDPPRATDSSPSA